MNYVYLCNDRTFSPAAKGTIHTHAKVVLHSSVQFAWLVDRMLAASCSARVANAALRGSVLLACADLGTISHSSLTLYWTT